MGIGGGIVVILGGPNGGDGLCRGSIGEEGSAVHDSRRARSTVPGTGTRFGEWMRRAARGRGILDGQGGKLLGPETDCGSEGIELASGESILRF